MDVALNPRLQSFLERKMGSGNYQSVDEVVEEALQLLMEREEKLEDLRREIQIGLDQAARGEVAPLDMEAIKAEARRRFESRAH